MSERRFGRKHHDRQPCVTCGRCCCGRCRSERGAGRWFAPVNGGYHACSPTRSRPTAPPPGPAGTSTGASNVTYEQMRAMDLRDAIALVFDLRAREG